MRSINTSLGKTVPRRIPPDSRCPPGANRRNVSSAPPAIVNTRRSSIVYFMLFHTPRRLYRDRHSVTQSPQLTRYVAQETRRDAEDTINPAKCSHAGNIGNSKVGAR